MKQYLFLAALLFTAVLALSGCGRAPEQVVSSPQTKHETPQASTPEEPAATISDSATTATGAAPSLAQNTPTDAQGNWALEPLPPGTNLEQRLNELARQRGVPLNVLTQQALVQLSNVWQEMRQTVNRPIEFYGKAVDENGEPLTGARAEISCQGYPEDFWKTNLLTQSDGTFQIVGRTGTVLYVHVTMTGYEELGGQNKFMYSSPLPNGGFQPDPHDPIIFRFRKKG
jgi:hypothetical protein